MRLNFEDILLNNTFDLNKGAFYISGNEKTLIKKIEEKLIEKLSINGGVEVERATLLDETNINNSLFFEKSLTILSGTKGLNKEKINSFIGEKNTLIVVSENSRGDAPIKKIFEKEANLALILCYQLTREQKIRILNFNLSSHQINIEKDAYWYFIENTEDKYVLFENEINKILLLNKKSCALDDIKKTLSVSFNDNFYKLFFSTLKNNAELINIYNSTINNVSDLYKLIYVIKGCFETIMSSENVQLLESSIPKYMFKDKKNFVEVYKKTNEKNKNKILKLIFKTEKLVRKHSTSYYSIGNRFLLNLKKILSSTNA